MVTKQLSWWQIALTNFNHSVHKAHKIFFTRKIQTPTFEFIPWYFNSWMAFSWIFFYLFISFWIFLINMLVTQLFDSCRTTPWCKFKLFNICVQKRGHYKKRFVRFRWCFKVTCGDCLFPLIFSLINNLSLMLIVWDWLQTGISSTSVVTEK